MLTYDIVECAQINISGGSATKTPTTYSLPGIYKQDDPGILINISSLPKNFTSYPSRKFLIYLMTKFVINTRVFSRPRRLERIELSCIVVVIRICYATMLGELILTTFLSIVLSCVYTNIDNVLV